MPDLQSELNKILTQREFDDDEDTKQAPVIATSSKELGETTKGGSLRARAWHYIKDHPNCTLGEVSAALGVTTPILAGGLHKMALRGNLTRVRNDAGEGFRYTALGDAYVVMTMEARVANMQKARAVMLANRAKKPSTKSKEPTKPAAPAPKAFDADAILAELNVLQARELMDKLRKLFGA